MEQAVIRGEGTAGANELDVRDLKVVDLSAMAVHIQPVERIICCNPLAEADIVSRPGRKIHADSAAVHIQPFKKAGVDFCVSLGTYGAMKSAEGQLAELCLIDPGVAEGQTGGMQGMGHIQQGTRVHTDDVSLDAQVPDDTALSCTCDAYA